jgi:hypothetical protein
MARPSTTTAAERLEKARHNQRFDRRGETHAKLASR